MNLTLVEKALNDFFQERELFYGMEYNDDCIEVDGTLTVNGINMEIYFHLAVCENGIMLIKYYFDKILQPTRERLSLLTQLNQNLPMMKATIDNRNRLVFLHNIIDAIRPSNVLAIIESTYRDFEDEDNATIINEILSILPDLPNHKKMN